jgi:branched-chain amino acid transport system ATP-binding protein
MLRVEGVSVFYGKACALSEVALEVAPGELVTLLGSNGAGKSTLLKTISGLLRPTSGVIRFDGAPLHELPSHKIVGKGVIHVPEGREIFPDLTVQENLKMGAFLRRDPDAERDMERVFALFPRLRERLEQRAGTLSGGEAQMLAIGRGLLSAPRLLMLDEPSLGLAPVVRDDIFQVIRQIHREQGMTLLLVEQNARMALSISSRAYILENGRVVRQGEAAALMDDPEVQRAYLGY